MKFVVLLALAGLANCRTTLQGGDRARDVTIEYTYLDDHGKEVTVEVKADNLELDLTNDSKLSLKKPSSSSSSVSRATGPSLQPEPAVHRFVEVQPPQPAAATRSRSRTVSVQPPAGSRLAPSFRLVELDDYDAPETRFVEVEAPKPKVETQFLRVEAPKPKVETQFVRVEAPKPRVETQFVRFEAPKPKVENRFVIVDFPEREFETSFHQVQSPRGHEALGLGHFALAKPAAAPRRAPPTTQFLTHRGFRSDANNSAEE
ncbi:uncharacterized protein LOC135205219 [Macrobrachium nipponense]|uniref:uncharacterized protein LOC135205219 n=1 Tax=Macrobrachium nipponense TaxID=159736 RepID=UPI0030C88677